MRKIYGLGNIQTNVKTTTVKVCVVAGMLWTLLRAGGGEDASELRVLEMVGIPYNQDKT